MAMNKLRSVFAGAGPCPVRGLLPYVTAGYPDLATTLAILKGLDPRRCLCVELGIPFSDPIADGPTIQTSFSRALGAGFRIEPFLEALGAAREGIPLPLVAMLSYSIVYRRGLRAFVHRLREAGFDGMIVPDLALEEADELAEVAREADCPLVLMAAPTTTPERRQRIAHLSEPFIYYQSVAGVTGERDHLPPNLAEQVRTLRAASGKPVCVGFGIARPEQVAAVCQVAEGAIVGSAIVRRMHAAVDRGAQPEEVAAEVHDLVEELTSLL